MSLTPFFYSIIGGVKIPREGGLKLQQANKRAKTAIIVRDILTAFFLVKVSSRIILFLVLINTITLIK